MFRHIQKHIKVITGNHNLFCYFSSFEIIIQFITSANVDVDQIIWNYPALINKIRDKSQFYNLESANKLLETFEGYCVKEVMPMLGVETASSRKGMQSLKIALESFQEGESAFYTCGFLTFFLGRNNSGSWFLVDTHPVPIECYGNAENESGIVLISDHPVGISEWIWRRISLADKRDERQSLIRVCSLVEITR